MKKQKVKFIHTFSLLLCILIATAFLHISKNASYISEFKSNVNDNMISTNQDSASNSSDAIDVTTSDELDASDEVSSSDAESVVALAANAPKSTDKKQFTVVIDPGHGGPDPGSSGKNGTQEKDVTLAVALKLGPMLEKKGYKVIYTRKTDKIAWSGQKAELLERASISNAANADLFISIHTNASEIKNIRGVETYYNKVSSNGKKVAQLIQTEVSKAVSLKNRGIKTENYSVLRNVSAPSILIELGYISTPAEETILKDPKYQSKFAQGIANGVVKYLEN